MKMKMQIVIQLVIALVGIVLLGLSISGRLQSNWPLCGSLGCLISSNALNILRIKQKEKENGSSKNR